ncbi:MAG: L-seryl-tRNA(Sec) selenium transferase [Candidatus Omnitrophica bacterium]|nr:L-seryl-tRNA(Sec) selenium transferase [Candidatus Omnitrophota bacterium]
MPPPFKDLLRKIPAVSDFITSGPGQEIIKRFGEGMLKQELRLLLSEIRTDITSGKINKVPDANELKDELMKRMDRAISNRGRYAVNAAGILLHTGLGRAPLCKEAIDALQVMNGYSILQADTSTGKRSSREEKIEKMMIELTGCEAATLVNNNAAATVLVLNTLAEGKEVILSRGQLIEIGGSFRIPEVMSKSSAILKEIGTTNRTHLRDYEKAVSENTGAFLHVHTSNFRVRGFAGVPDIIQLCELGKKLGIPVIDDLGSGALIKLSDYGISDEPLIVDSINAGSDVVCFSGDKLISGPQCGIICGKKDIINQIRKNPFARMFRVCKLTLAALEATLVHFINGTYKEAIPFYRMLGVTVDVLNKRAIFIKETLDAIPELEISLADDVSYVGSGSLPDEGIPTKIVRIIPGKDFSKKTNVDEISKQLRMLMPSIFCRVNEGALCFDMRTLFDGEEQEIINGMKKVVEILK